MKSSCSVIAMVVIAAFVAGFVPAPAQAGGSDEARPIHLYATESFGPIGRIATNSPSGDALIWGGEVITAAADKRVRVALDSVGLIILTPGTAVRVARGRATSESSGCDVLVASLMRGRIEVRLDAGAGAYVEATRSAFIASRGASFAVSIDGGRASLATLAGAVQVQDQPAPPQDVNIRLVDDLGRPVASGAQFSVRARSTRQVQVQVTDKNDKPLPDLPVLFSLGDPCVGTLGLGAAAGAAFMTQKTDKRGIAAVPLVAGAARCAASIIAKVEGTNASLTIKTNVTPNTSFFSPRNSILIGAGLVGAGLGVYFGTQGSASKEAITPVPPPNVKP